MKDIKDELKHRIDQLCFNSTRIHAHLLSSNIDAALDYSEAQKNILDEMLKLFNRLENEIEKTEIQEEYEYKKRDNRKNNSNER